MSTFSKFDVNLVSISEIDITNAHIENNTGLTSLEKETTFTLTFGFIPGLNLELKRIRILFTCEITPESNDKKVVAASAKFEIAFFIEVQNLLELVTLGEQGLSAIDETLLGTVANIVYSTARGIIFSRCQGTVLKSFMLPVMPTKALTEMLQPVP